MSKSKVKELTNDIYSSCVDWSHAYNMSDNDLLDALSLCYNKIVIKAKLEK